MSHLENPGGRQSQTRERLVRASMFAVAWYVGGIAGNAIAGNGIEALGYPSTYSPVLLFEQCVLAIATPAAQVAVFGTAVVGVLFVWSRWPRWLVVLPLAGWGLATYLQRTAWQGG